MNKIKTIFIGTSDFAVPLLNTILNLEYIDLKALITQPDKPVGRKQILAAPPTKSFLLENGIDLDILQPKKIRLEAKNILERYEPQLIIVASYGQIIPESILNYPQYGCLNIHVSLLPKLRGAVPMPMAILQGLKKTGVTLQKMSKEMDKGEIIAIREIEIDDKENTETLTKKSSKEASQMIKEELHKWIKGEIKLIPQSEKEATYCYKEDISKQNAEITFETDVNLAERMIRAFYPWPIAWIKYGSGKILKLYKAELLDSKINTQFGLKREGKTLLLKLKSGTLELLEVQLEGKKRDLAKNYLFLASK